MTELGFCDGSLSPACHMAYFRSVQSRSSRQAWKSASVRFERNTRQRFATGTAGGESYAVEGQDREAQGGDRPAQCDQRGDDEERGQADLARFKRVRPIIHTGKRTVRGAYLQDGR
jgi:hypothetical protein